jgi:hypothetical protein
MSRPCPAVPLPRREAFPTYGSVVAFSVRKGGQESGCGGGGLASRMVGFSRGSGAAQHRRVEGVGPGVAVVPVWDGDGVGSRRLMAGRMQELSRGGSSTYQIRSGHRDVDGDHGDTGGRLVVVRVGCWQELDAELQPSGRQPWSLTASAIAAFVDRKILILDCVGRLSPPDAHVTTIHPQGLGPSRKLDELMASWPIPYSCELQWFPIVVSPFSDLALSHVHAVCSTKSLQVILLLQASNGDVMIQWIDLLLGGVVLVD